MSREEEEEVRVRRGWERVLVCAWKRVAKVVLSFRVEKIRF